MSDLQIPALLGNIVGGVLMVGTAYWYLNLTGGPEVSIDGVEFGTAPQRLTGESPGTSTPVHRRSSEEKGKSADDMV